MNPDEFRGRLRRVVTGVDGSGRSAVVIDAGPSAASDPFGLFEIWSEALDVVLDPLDHTDRGPRDVTLGPMPRAVKVRWFTLTPPDPSADKQAIDDALRSVWRQLGTRQDHVDQSRHSAMHGTETFDVVCVLAGEVRLVMDDGETRLRPGNVVIQRGTAHAWEAVGGPALLLAVMVDRSSEPSPDESARP